MEAELAVPLAPPVTGRWLQQATPSTAQTLEKINKEVTQNLQKLIKTKFTQKFGEELIRSVAKGAVSGVLSKIPVPIVGEVLGCVPLKYFLMHACTIVLCMHHAC